MGPDRHFGSDLDQARDWPEALAGGPGPAQQGLLFPFPGYKKNGLLFWGERGRLPPRPARKNPIFFLFVGDQSLAWLVSSQVLPTPGGRYSGRLRLSVRTWLAEAATAADLKGEAGGGAKPTQQKTYTLFLDA